MGEETHGGELEMNDTNNTNGNGHQGNGRRPKRVRGTNPEFLNNQWKPGQSGNPKGRPKKKSISEELHDLMEDLRKRKNKNMTTREALAEVIIEQALAGRFTFMKEILDRTEGKVADKVQMSGPQGEPLFQFMNLSEKNDRDTFYKLLQRSGVERSDQRGN